MKNIKDYLHLYVGGKFLADGKEFKLCGVSYDEHGTLAYDGTFTKDTSDYDIPSGWWVENCDFKLILRPLSDMTEAEASEMWNLMGWNEKIRPAHRAQDIIREFTYIEYEDGGNSNWGYLLKILPYLLSKSFDLFGLIESCLAIDSSALTKETEKPI